MQKAFVRLKAFIRHRHIHDGDQYFFRYANHYGASVVRHCDSYGGPAGLYELAVIKYDNNDDWDIVYDTPITYDVLGWLKPAQVLKTLKEISKLPA